MNIFQQIEKSEAAHKPYLEEFLSMVLGRMRLDSHGISHHRRVWGYAREIICSMEFETGDIDPLFTDKLLIASYLHDSGMVIDTGPKHGLQSRILCEQYLEKSGLNETAFSDLLDVIENHDNKDYHSPRNEPLFGTVLNIADDLDAFGITGIYRYLEIYLVRSVHLEDIGHKIVANASARFKNLESALGKMPGIIKEQRERYNILESFFVAYNLQARNYPFGTGSFSGYCGIAELIKQSIENSFDIYILLANAENARYDNIIRNFFRQLRNELIISSNEN